ncbi:MAG: hypothetical protein NZM44_00050 [Candidatus Calescibacterium sp.]|nr:hypothetical protein [Candidatus Calescibacterium sp.]
MGYIVSLVAIVFCLLIIISCSGGGGGGIGPIPTIDTPTFPTLSTTTTHTFTTTNTFPTTTNTTTTNSLNYKFLYVKVLRKTSNGDIEWLGSLDWNQTAYVYFSASNWNNDKTVYVDDGRYGTYTKFNYDTYTINQVDIGIYSYYRGWDFKVYIGNYYNNYSSEAWYGQFTVDYYNPYGHSIYVVFEPGRTLNKLHNKLPKTNK